MAGEFGDGYQTIINARYFFGDGSTYYIQRGPLAALALWPVEAIAGLFDLNPVDVRPYHLYSAVLHIAYIVGCWLLLKRTVQTPTIRLLGFAAAILSTVFFAGAPYLSHDIIPGFLFLLFVFLCNRFITTPDWRLAIALVVLGAGVTFIKQTYAIFWVSITIYTGLAFLFRWHDGLISWQRMLTLFGLAGISAAISWIGYGWFYGGQLPHVPLLERPLVLLGSISSQYVGEADVAELFPADIYLRNLHNYGMAAMLMVLPGIVLAMRGKDHRLRMVAICFLVSAIVMQTIGFREVRYLAYLAPLTAMLILPVIALVAKQRWLFGVLLALLCVDQFRGLNMAAAQLSRTPGMSVTRFVGATDYTAKTVSSDDMSFAYMARSPMLRDRYHGIHHLTADHLFRLHEGRLDVRVMRDPEDIGEMGIEPGDRVLFSNRTLVRRPPWQADNSPLGLEQAFMSAGTATMITLQLEAGLYHVDEHAGRYVMLIPPPGNVPLIAMDNLAATAVTSTYGVNAPATITVVGVLVDALCQADNCSWF